MPTNIVGLTDLFNTIARRVSLRKDLFPLPLGSGYYRTFKKKIGGPFAVAVRRNYFPY